MSFALNGYVPPHKFKLALDYVGLNQEKDGSFRDYMAKFRPPADSGKLHSEASFLQPPYDLCIASVWQTPAGVL